MGIIAGTFPMLGHKLAQYVITQAAIGNYVPLGISIAIVVAFVVVLIVAAVKSNAEDENASETKETK